MDRCCICCDPVNAFEQDATIKYTSCCVEAVCQSCQADLLSSAVNSGNFLCLKCNKAITSTNLFHPATLVLDQLDNQISQALFQLDSQIRPYFNTITALKSQLDNHVNTVAKLRSVFGSLDQVDVSAKLDQEQYRVIKPLQTTIRENMAVLTNLEYIANRLTVIKASLGPSLTLSHQGLAQQLIKQADATEARWSPQNLVIRPLWYYRHPIKAGLFDPEHNPWSISTTDHVKITLEPDLVATGYTQSFQEIAPGQYVAIIKLFNHTFIFNLDSQLLFTLTCVQDDSVKISSQYLVWLEQAGLHYYRLEQTFKATPVDLTNQSCLVTTAKVTVLALEQDLLWYYHEDTAVLSCHNLDTNQNLSNYTIANLGDFHCGIYYTVETYDSRRPLKITALVNRYYLIRSLAYPEAFLESMYKPKIYLDGTVIYNNGKCMICHTEDFTDSHSHNNSKNLLMLSPHELTSSGGLMSWSDQVGKTVAVKFYG